MIDEEILAKLISDKSGISRKQAQAQIDELAGGIKSAVDAGEVFEVEGLGTFKQEQNKTVFEADDILQTEINQKYAGMRPIELMGSFKETAAAQPVNSDEITPPVKTPEEPPVPETETSESEFESSEEPKEPAINTEEVDKASREPSSRSAVKEREKETTIDSQTGVVSIILIVAAVIAAILLAGWLLYTMGLFSKSDAAGSAPMNTAEVIAVDKTRKKSDNIETAGLAVVEGNKNQTEGVKDVSNAENMLYGLRGTVHPKAQDGYTIVVHSLWCKNHAFETLETIKQKGYRTVMLNANVNGRAYWRIGIGQFKTIGDARIAADKLPEPYRNNYFIKHQ